MKNNINWSWASAAMLAGAALPVAALIIFGSPEVSKFGIVAAIGLIPAAVVPLPPTRRKRIMLPIIGVAFAASMLVGSLLTQSPAVAVVAMGVLAFLVSYFSSKAALVALSGFATAMILPLIGVGLSYSDVPTILLMGAAIIAGSVWVYILTLLFRKETKPAQRPAPQPAPQSVAVIYGVFYAGAAVTATTVAFALGLEHVGWVVGATLFVMRPSWQVEWLRVIGRVASVFIGANLAALVLSTYPSPVVTAILISLAVVLAAATQGSRWYITPAFTTFIVFFVLLYGDTVSGDIAFRLEERVVETLFGVGIALVFGFVASFATRLHTPLPPIK